MIIFHIFDIKNIFFTVLGYPMSYVEFIGTIFNLWCVWLAAKAKISTWPIGIVGIVFYIFLFYQIQFYSDLIEQFYFLVMSFYGWWTWAKIKSEGEKKEKSQGIKFNTKRNNIITLIILVVGSFALTELTTHLNSLFPSLFPLPASYPFLDAFTTVMSFVATVLLARKIVESWYLWILVDVIGVWLYYVRGVKFIALEYLIFLVMATYGMLDWFRILRKTKGKLGLGGQFLGL